MWYLISNAAKSFTGLYEQIEVKYYTWMYYVFLNVTNRKKLTLDAGFQISVKSCIGGMNIWQYWPLKNISVILFLIWRFLTSKPYLIFWLSLFDMKIPSAYKNTTMSAKASSSYQSLYYCYSAICLQISLSQHLPREAWPVQLYTISPNNARQANMCSQLWAQLQPNQRLCRGSDTS